MNPEIMAGYPEPAIDATAPTPTRRRAATQARLRGLAGVRQLPVHGDTRCPTAARGRYDPYWPPTTLVDRVNEFAYGGAANKGRAPPCVAQAPLGAAAASRH